MADTKLSDLTAVTTPGDTDLMYVAPTGASNKVTWANIKATLKTYFDTLYLALTGGTVAGGTRTTSGSTLTITETLNNAAVTFPGALIVDVTDTASNAASLLANFKVGGTSKFVVRKDASIGVYTGGIGDASGNRSLVFNNTGIAIVQGGRIGWGSAYSGSSGAGGACDLELQRDTADILAQRRSTNAQTFRTYGTYTDASNYRRVGMTMTTGGVGTIAPEGAGTGASGNCLVLSNGSVTLATLPAASTAGAGARAFVSDASTTLILGLGGTVTGGGANKVPVYSDGTNWIYG